MMWMRTDERNEAIRLLHETHMSIFQYSSARTEAARRCGCSLAEVDALKLQGRLGGNNGMVKLVCRSLPYLNPNSAIRDGLAARSSSKWLSGHISIRKAVSD